LLHKFAIIGGLCVCACVTGTSANADSPVFSLDGSAAYGPIHGFVQTPSGGEAGTTSEHRPTLDELGINRTWSESLGAAMEWNKNVFTLGVQINQMSGTSTLDSDLITHGVTFPAGTEVHSDVDLNLYQLGYRRDFDFGPQQQWTISPLVTADAFDFNYKLHGGGQSTSRGYIKPTFQLGANLEWSPNNGPFSIDLGAGLTPPINGLAQIDQEWVAANFRFFDHLTVSAGVQFEQIRFEDKQTVANHISIDEGPMFVVGLKWTF
jgi:hypothetical protein